MAAPAPTTMLQQERVDETPIDVISEKHSDHSSVTDEKNPKSAAVSGHGHHDDNDPKKHVAELKDIEAAVHAEDDAEVEAARQHRHELEARYRTLILGALALLILAWWISSLVLPATRHRWIVQSLFAWAFLA